MFFLQGKTHMRQGEPAQAEAHLLEALRRAPETPEIYETLAALALSNGNAAEALVYCQDLLTLVPDHPFARKAVPVLQASLTAA